MAQLMQVSMIRQDGSGGDVACDGQSRNRKGLGGMRAGRVVAVLAAAVLTTVALAACDDSPTVNRTPSPTITEPTTSPTPTETAPPSPTPTPTPDEDIAAANAEAILREYYATVDRIGGDPAHAVEALRAVAAGIVLDSDQQKFSEWRRDGWVQKGTIRLVQVDLVDVSLDNSDPAHGKVPAASFDVCFDISGGDVVDSSGASIVPADQPPRAWERITVANASWETDPEGAWRVTGAETLEREPCDAD